MRAHPGVHFDFQLDDHMVNLVEHGIDVALRMGQFADSALGSRFLGLNPWLTAASPAYLARHGTPSAPAELAMHDCIVYSSVQGDQRWHFQHADQGSCSVAVGGPVRTNDVACVLQAVCAGLGVAILPVYLARPAIERGDLVPLLPGHHLPAQPMHAVYPSPRLVPAKVQAWIGFLQAHFTDPAWTECGWGESIEASCPPASSLRERACPRSRHPLSPDRIATTAASAVGLGADSPGHRGPSAIIRALPSRA
jgi:DNA-binding transcriptional LysR family regulator